MHATGTVGVVNFQLTAFHPHTFCGTKVDDLFIDVKRTPVLAAFESTSIGRIASIVCNVLGYGILINFDVVFPGTDEGQSERAMEATQPLGHASNLNLNL
jgi:hypothetical protein